MNLKDLKNSGHLPTLITAFLYFDVSFMVWTVLGPLGAQIGQTLELSPQEKGVMVAFPILSGAVLRIVLGFAVDRFGAKRTGIAAQGFVAAGLVAGWHWGLPTFFSTLLMGVVLGFAGASFSVALPQAGRWYPPHMQGLVLGLAGAGNVGVVLDSLIAPRLAAAYGWQDVFGWALVPVLLVLVIYTVFSREAPGEVKPKRLTDYADLFKQRDAHWFFFYYTISFGGFVGLASSFVLYFTSQYGLSPVRAGDLAALATLCGALLRPVGGGLADKIGGIRALTIFYSLAGLSLLGAALIAPLAANLALLLLASASFGMANGSVFQLLPQRFSREMGLMTGLVGCGGGIGGFLLATLLGYSKGWTGNYSSGLLIFAGMCALALCGLSQVKSRWRSTWGAVSGARI
ncbi:MAG: NarK/NasA family nitrate transporter [Chthoniobacterales bacterium]|nr:NarK/NasA family nitrate transporter [Chthoniobacterales bacterium]